MGRGVGTPPYDGAVFLVCVHRKMARRGDAPYDAAVILILGKS